MNCFLFEGIFLAVGIFEFSFILCFIIMNHYSNRANKIAKWFSLFNKLWLLTPQVNVMSPNFLKYWLVNRKNHLKAAFQILKTVLAIYMPIFEQLLSAIEYFMVTWLDMASDTLSYPWLTSVFVDSKYLIFSFNNYFLPVFARLPLERIDNVSIVFKINGGCFW